MQSVSCLPSQQLDTLFSLSPSLLCPLLSLPSSLSLSPSLPPCPEEESLTSAVPPQKPSRQRRHSQLRDITEEEEEDVSSGEPLAPPRDLELDRQFVEGDGYGVALTWLPPSPIPPSATGYNIYVNGELMSNVLGADQTNVIISGVPRKQVSQE